MVSYDEKDRFAVARSEMVQNQLMRRDITDSAVLEVMRTIPREEFVNAKYISQAYDDNPLPIGMGQTISQPYIVALMSQWLELNENCEVLEIGTGCGYQTAIIAQLAKRVYTIERIGQLMEMAQANLSRLGIENVEFYVGDGSCGWPESRHFDRIIITAAVPKVPKPLVDQLHEDGRMVVPVGDNFAQELVQYRRKGDKLEGRFLCGCRFVPVIGKYGFIEGE